MIYNENMWQLLGQDRVITLLKHELETRQLPHANLLLGPVGIGKMTLALDLAQSLNCTGDEPPCGNCYTCLRIKSAKHPDIHIIDLQSESKGERKQEVKIGIEYINDLQSMAKTPPYEGKYKVFIINGAENLSIEAANTLLKTLEEPPPHIVIILLASSERDVLPTIVSRCQRLELNPVPLKQLENILIEKYKLDIEQAAFLARISHGCPGQVLSAIQNDKFLNERTDILNTLVEIIHSNREGRLNFASHLTSEFNKNRRSINIIFTLWLDWWRDLFLIREKNQELIINIDRKTELVNHAVNYTTQQIDIFIREIQATRKYLSQNANSRLVLESLMLNIPSAHISTQARVGE